MAAKTSPRILQISNYAGPLYCFMLPLCSALEQMGAEVELACMPGGALWEPLQRSDFKVHMLPEGNWSRPKTWRRLYRRIRLLLRTCQFDLMIVHTPAMSWVARPAAHGLVPATIYFSHGLPFAPEQPWLTNLVFRSVEQFMARYTDAIIVMNRDDAAACRRFKLTRTDGRWHYVPGVGVDVDTYAERPAENLVVKLEQKLGLRPGRPMVLFLGRFIKAKRPGDVLELARRIGPEVDFVLAGEGPLWKQTKKAGAKIGSHVKVIEFTDKVQLLLARCTVLVLPSVFREGLPRVLLEACAAGKPVVAYDVRGSRDIIERGQTGYLVPPRNVGQLHEAVSSLLKDSKLSSKMGQAGRERIRKEFSTQASVFSIIPAVREVLQQTDIHRPQQAQG